MALTHLVETSALVEPPDAARAPDGELATSVICLGELQAAILLARSDADRIQRVALLATVQANLPSLDIDASVATAYGQLRARSRRVGSNDLWIAATALAHGLVLVTRDEALARLPGIEVLLA